MTPPLPNPIDVNLHSGPAEWWQFLAGLTPLAALIAAGIAGWIAWKSLRQKSAADNRAEWWRRAQWAFDSILSDEPRRAQAGLRIIAVLAQDPPGAEELKIIEGATDDSLGVAEGPALRPFSRHDYPGVDTSKMESNTRPEVPSADSGREGSEAGRQPD
ncbi:hypothetical protein ACIQTZ_20150 [Paenarthrobacter sp. NPDC090520]|uniref:hypothetical protein n=1 Tax=Paenarthrobacter sp. NPDC090520 TaxID=3364382 RepID=UPI003823D668